MTLDRRQLLAAGGVALGSCAAPRGGPAPTPALDALFEAHADNLPENGGGANHYTMAAEALEALGHGHTIDPYWSEDAPRYAGEPLRRGPIREETGALGHYDRWNDWLDLFQGLLQQQSWQRVVGVWAPRLAPGLVAATFHGVLRTAHAVRALRRSETPARLHELAAGLAYWASRYTELPTAPTAVAAASSVGDELQALDYPWLDDPTDVDFHDVVSRMLETPVAPPIRELTSVSVEGELQATVRDAAVGFLEMLVQERNRIWILHTVTGPAAVDLLLPYVDDVGARSLVAHARQAVVALYAAYGEPFTPRAHLRTDLAPWSESIARATTHQTVHGIKLIEALHRFDRDGDPVWCSVAAQWFEWT